MKANEIFLLSIIYIHKYSMYISTLITLCLCVCLTGYRLSPWSHTDMRRYHKNQYDLKKYHWEKNFQKSDQQQNY
jgi:hypothetical protein